MITSAASSRGRAPVEEAAARPAAHATLLDAVADLRRDVAATRFPLAVAGADAAEAARTRLLDQLDDHLLPRLRELSAPAVVVVAGSTGAGKSTLVNSVLGAEVSKAGVLRPTTRRPVLVHHPADGELLADHPLRSVVEVVEREEVPRGVALVDAPDLDSLLESNRATAHRLLEAADLWVFVTTATRYGDALPWSVLERASDRGTSIAMVLNRVPAAARTAIRTDLLHRLRDRGLGSVPLFLVPDLGPHEGLLEQRHVAPVRRWLSTVAGRDQARAVIARTQHGALVALRPWVDELAEAVQAQVDARHRLEGAAEEAARQAAASAAKDVAHVAEGPVRSRWTAAASGSGPLAGSWGRRGASRRAEALEDLRGELERAATLVLTAARRRGRRAVVEALEDSGVPGAAALPDVVPSEDDAPAASAAGWLRTADAAVSALADADPATARRLARLARVAGPRGAATTVLTAAAGLGAARVVLTGLLGPVPTEDVVGRLRQDLVERAARLAGAADEPVRAALEGEHLADDAASTLRLRLAVLKGIR